MRTSRDRTAIMVAAKPGVKGEKDECSMMGITVFKDVSNREERYSHDTTNRMIVRRRWVPSFQKVCEFHP